MDDEMTVTEAAAVKGVTRSAINRAIAEGRLPARAELRPGYIRAIWKIKRDDVEAWEPASAQERGRRSGEARRREG